jgi:UDP-N-acetylmuramate: L-alanyl-gamma-D-glutamyl-meso-diaminopimelate ligase
MLTWVLEAAGQQPGFLIGGVPENFGVSARLGRTDEATRPDTGHPFVIEADEYDTAFFDKRSKFVHDRPRTAVLNNLEFDHADIFENLAAIETQFHHLVRTVPHKGRLVCNGREEALQRVLARGSWSDIAHFGVRGDVPGFRARGEPHSFDVLKAGVLVGRVEWSLMGEHNQLNALAAIAAAEHVGIAPADACEALGRFANVKRRLELRGEVRHITVYDDFAHHPTAIRTTLDGLRRRLSPDQRILAVFEPRSNTMKLGTMKALLPWSLEDADLAFCHSGGLGWDAHEALAEMGDRAVVADSIDALVSKIVKAARPGDQILCMSNGGFGGIHDKLLKALA